MSKDRSMSVPQRRMRSFRRLLIVAATATALTVLAPTVSAAPGGHPGRAFHLAKVCGDAGCTVTKSSYEAIQKGTLITYQGAAADALVATVNARRGTAVGNCNILPVFLDAGPGQCVFTGGTGSLKHFSITVEVTLDGATGLWHWDGTFDRPAPDGPDHHH